jgi:hypothetical protein
MAGPPTKAELLGRTRAARATWDERFAAIPGNQLETPAWRVIGRRAMSRHLTT